MVLSNIQLRRPSRYTRKEKCIAAWHGYLTASAGGEYPLLKTLALASGIPRATAYHYCKRLELPLFQRRPRKSQGLFPIIRKELPETEASGLKDVVV